MNWEGHVTIYLFLAVILAAVFVIRPKEKAIYVAVGALVVLITITLLTGSPQSG